MKILWIDCETTGLDPIKNDIITLSAMIEIDKKVIDSIDLKIQPHSWDNIEDSAMRVNRISRGELGTFDKPLKALNKLKNFLGLYVNKYDRKDKLQPAGYNVVFDTNFLSQFFSKCDDKYYGAWVDYHKLDVASIVQFLHLKGVLDLDNYKLVTVAKALDIDFKAHDAKEDIIATRKICYKLLNMIEVK